MAGGPSVYQANLTLNKSLKGVDYTPPTVVYIALLTTASETAARANNIAGASEVPNAGGYARQAVTVSSGLTTSTAGQIVNVNDIPFPTATATWGNCQQAAIMDSPTIGAGNILYFGPLTAPANVQNGDSFSMPAGTIQINA